MEEKEKKWQETAHILRMLFNVWRGIFMSCLIREIEFIDMNTNEQKKIVGINKNMRSS